MASLAFSDQPLLWSSLIAACKLPTLISSDSSFISDETSVCMKISPKLQPRNIRDWLYDEHIQYIMTGNYSTIMSNNFIYLDGVRWRFTDFDDKLLFSLRWI